MPRTPASSGTPKANPAKKSAAAAGTKPTAARATSKKAQKTARSTTPVTKKPGRAPARDNKPGHKATSSQPGRKPAGKKPAGKKPGSATATKPRRSTERNAATGRAPAGSVVSTAAGRVSRGAQKAVLVHATLRELEGPLKALSKLDIVAPNIPVERLVAEGVELATVAWRDLAKLSTAGLDRMIVVELGKRAQALSEAQAELSALRSQGRSSEEEDLIAEASELRSEALAAGRLALRNDPVAMGKLDDIAEGEGLEDLLHDLQDLAVVLRSYSRAYSQVGLKPAELANWSETLRLRLSKYISEGRPGDAGLVAAKDLRDRAATYLAEVVTLTRLAGCYVFRKDPRRLLSYRSVQYAPARRPRGTDSASADDPKPSPAVPTPDRET